MKVVSNKERCIQMWEWLANHPECDKNDYMKENPHLLDCGEKYRLFTKASCWACVECIERKRNSKDDSCDVCDLCPIKEWTPLGNNQCEAKRSPYTIWGHFQDARKYGEPGKFLPKQVTKAALAIVNLCETQWED